MPKAINGAINERWIEFFRLNFPLRNETRNDTFFVYRLRFSPVQITNEKRMPVASKKKERTENAYDKRKTEEKKNHFKK